MPRSPNTWRLRATRRATRSIAMLLVATAGFGAAALTGLALAKPRTTLGVAKNAKVTNTKGVSKTESVVSDAHGVSVYTLTHDTIRHPGCTKANGCFAFWFPVTVASKNTKLTKASGIKGKLGIFHRNGFFQLTLNKHPLYTFKFDKNRKGVAIGEGIPSFGGVWHVALAAATKNTTKTTPTTTMTSPTTMPCLYPPCY